MNIGLLVFDWSGVISDDRRPVYKANMRILREYGKPVLSFEEWLQRSRMTAVEFLADNGVHGEDEELFALYKRYYDDAIRSGIVPEVYPDVHDALQHLMETGKKLAVLSSHPADNLRKEAQHYNLMPFLNSICGSSKEKSSGLIEVCKELGMDPQISLYLGDTVYDIRAAKQAGINSAGVCTGYHAKERLEEERPDFLLENLSELKKIIVK